MSFTLIIISFINTHCLFSKVFCNICIIGILRKHSYSKSIKLLVLPTLLSFNVELCVCIWTSSAIYSYIHIYIINRNCQCLPNILYIQAFIKQLTIAFLATPSFRFILFLLLFLISSFDSLTAIEKDRKSVV